MMDDDVKINMTLDDIIRMNKKQKKASSSTSGPSINRSRSRSRSRTQRFAFDHRSQSRARSMSSNRNRSRSRSRARSASQGRFNEEWQNGGQSFRSRSRSRSKGPRHSHSGQQWRLERGWQLQQRCSRSRSRSQPRQYARNTDCSRSVSQFSNRSGSQPPSLLSLSARYGQSNNQLLRLSSVYRQKPFCANSAHQVRMRNRSQAYIQGHKIGQCNSAYSVPILRRMTLLQQLRLAQHRVRIAKRILNDRQLFYLDRLRLLNEQGNIVTPSQYKMRMKQENPAWSTVHQSNTNFYHAQDGQQISSNQYSLGTLTITFENELARRASDSVNNLYHIQSSAEEIDGPPGLKPAGETDGPPGLKSRTEVNQLPGLRQAVEIDEPPGLRVNGFVLRSPSVGKVNENNTVHVSPQGTVRKTVLQDTDTIPGLLSSSEIPHLVKKSVHPYIDFQKISIPTSRMTTLNERFTAHQVA